MGYEMTGKNEPFVFDVSVLAALSRALDEIAQDLSKAMLGRIVDHMSIVGFEVEVWSHRLDSSVHLGIQRMNPKSQLPRQAHAICRIINQSCEGEVVVIYSLILESKDINMSVLNDEVIAEFCRLDGFFGGRIVLDLGRLYGFFGVPTIASTFRIWSSLFILLGLDVGLVGVLLVANLANGNYYLPKINKEDEENHTRLETS